MKLFRMQFFPFSCHFIPLRSKYSPQHPVFKNQLSLCSSLNVRGQVSQKSAIMRFMQISKQVDTVTDTEAAGRGSNTARGTETDRRNSQPFPQITMDRMFKRACHVVQFPAVKCLPTFVPQVTSIATENDPLQTCSVLRPDTKLCSRLPVRLLVKHILFGYFPLKFLVSGDNRGRRQNFEGGSCNILLTNLRLILLF
jgi:hypothetical protein